MGMYVKKPVVIEAKEYTGYNVSQICDWCGGTDTNFMKSGQIVIETLEGEMLANIGDYIIKGVNGEFYPCKPDIFEKTYDKVKNTMGFADALKILIAGGKIARQGWNGKRQFIELASNISYKTTNDEIINPMHETMGNKAIAFVGTSGVQLGWLASQADMLSEDWVELI